MTSNHHWVFPYNWGPSLVIKLHFESIPRDSTEKGGGNIRI